MSKNHETSVNSINSSDNEDHSNGSPIVERKQKLAFGLDIGGSLSKIVFFDPDELSFDEECDCEEEAEDLDVTEELIDTINHTTCDSNSGNENNSNDRDDRSDDSNKSSSSNSSRNNNKNNNSNSNSNSRNSRNSNKRRNDMLRERQQGHRIRSFLDSSTQYGETGRKDDLLRLGDDEEGCDGDCDDDDVAGDEWSTNDEWSTSFPPLSSSSLQRQLIAPRKRLRGYLHFVKFETRRFDNFIKLVSENTLLVKHNRVEATGGGAYKFDKVLRETLGVKLVKHDELESLVTGVTFLLQHVKNECFIVKNFKEEDKGALEREFIPYFYKELSKQEFLLVNIGSGVSMLKVESAFKFERVGGTSLGGGSFLGLCALLTGCSSFEHAISLAEQGDSTNVDTLVKDIYGGDYEQFHLKGTTVASSFGAMMNPENRKNVKKEDLAKATLTTITNNIGAIAFMKAKELNIERVVFVGNFLNGNDISLKLLAFAMDFWSKGEKKAYFMEHEGYFGACGALFHFIYGI